MWSNRQVDRFITWLRGPRHRRRAPATDPAHGGDERRGQALEAVVPVPADEALDDDHEECGASAS